MSHMQQFLNASYKVFNLNEEGRGKRNKHYIRVPAIVSKGSLQQTSERSPALTNLNNPFVFITNRWVLGEPQYSSLDRAGESSVTFVVGQYGLGKTELVHQVCQYLLKNEQPDGLIPLPVNLALCRGEVGELKEEMSKKEFARFLFSRILHEAGFKLSYVQSELFRQIHEGKILLLLDGLDELLSSSFQNHYFLSNLSRFLTAGAANEQTAPKFRAVVSMRLEYLSSVTSWQDGSDLTTILNSAAPTTVTMRSYFLKLDFLDDSRVEAYFDSRLINGRESFEKVSKNKRLLDMLRRPLLLRIFCDLAKLRGPKELHLLLDSLKNNEHPSGLLKIFVEWAQADERTTKAQKRISSLTWDADELARKSVKLYEAGRTDMGLEDVREILRDTNPGAEKIPIKERNLEPTEILDGIHKCPFLWKDVRPNGDRTTVIVHFGHKIFFEYFVARGIVLYKESGDYNPWMNLVLNVDMRKFLRGMIDDCEWYERTKKSYALEGEDLNTWKFRDRIDFNELGKERRLFLDYMTDPENEKYMRDADGSLAKAVNGFLDKEELLHPRYRLYTYEAVALYISFHRWDEHTPMISRRFGETLEKRFEEIHESLILEESSDRVREALELLVERILHIGQRLRYAWVREYVAKKDELLTLIKDPGSNNRIAAIFKDIEKSQF